MPSCKVHKKIDDEVLKPMRLIAKNYDSELIHKSMDEGTTHHGWRHQVLDKWHDPEWVARVGFHIKLMGNIPQWRKKEYKTIYRVAKVHFIVDELWFRYKARNGKYPNFDYLKKHISQILNNKDIRRRQF